MQMNAEVNVESNLIRFELAEQSRVSQSQSTGIELEGTCRKEVQGEWRKVGQERIWHKLYSKLKLQNLQNQFSSREDNDELIELNANKDVDQRLNGLSMNFWKHPQHEIMHLIVLRRHLLVFSQLIFEQHYRIS
jgi:hypothetical protein